MGTALRAVNQSETRATKRDLMSENVRGFVAEQVQPAARGQELEAGLGQCEPVLADQKGFESGPERVQMEHVGGGVGELLRAELGRAPVGGLLLLGDFHAEQLAAEVAQAVAVGEGA